MPFCIEALERALRWGRPEIFNSDQGSQFTSEKFTGVLKEWDIAVSMGMRPERRLKRRNGGAAWPPPISNQTRLS